MTLFSWLQEPISIILSFFYLVPFKNPFLQSSVPSPELLRIIDDAIPYFLSMMALEFLFSLYKHRTLYSFKDAIMSMSLGMQQQLVVAWIHGLKIGPYMIVHQHFGPLREALLYFVPGHEMIISWITHPFPQFILSMLGCDLTYYIFHRLCHQQHLMWVGHSVHHSGERYNLATALRQGIAQLLFGCAAFLPLAALGLSPIEYFRHFSLNILYQFWIHTEFIGKFPLLMELIMNTPSHHRMHHRPPGNCNYAGVLIIWDRIFCSFVPESPYHSASTATDGRGVVYGLARPLTYPFDPLYANIAHVDKIYQSQKYLANKRDEKATSQSNGLAFIQSWFKVLPFIFKKRVDAPWRIARSWQELCPEITHQTTLADFFSCRQVFEMPPLTDEDIPSKNAHALQVDQKKNESSIQYLEQRLHREGKALNGYMMGPIALQVAVTVIVNVYITLTSPHITQWNEKVQLSVLTVLSLVSLQSFQYYY